MTEVERFHQAADKVLGAGGWREEFYYCASCDQWMQIIFPKSFSVLSAECEECGEVVVMERESTEIRDAGPPRREGEQ